MNKEKWNNFPAWFKDRLNFLKMEEEPGFEEEPVQEDSLQVEEKPLASGNILKIDLPEGDLKEKLERNRIRKRRIMAAILLVVVCVVGSFVLYNQLHTFEDYIIAESYENEVAAGTKYESVGKYIYRYNSDGVSCVTRQNEVVWSITYNMQAPIVDVCGTTMVVAEQQGNQIYVVNEDGLVGNFATQLSILKVRVSNQGVVAAVLNDEDVTWVNLYQSDGTTIVSDRTTVAESGYPLDVDVSPNGQLMAVSYLGIEEGIMATDVVFYDFESGSTSDNYVAGSEKFTETVMPEIYFTDNSQAIAVSDQGFVVFKGGGSPRQSASVTFEEEIISTFHDDSRIGFIFAGDEEHDYRLEVYSYSGKRRASRGIDAEFEKVKIENGQILMYGDSMISTFSLSGRKRFSSAYEKTIEEVFYLSEFRKYMVITRDSIDRIRIS